MRKFYTCLILLVIGIISASAQCNDPSACNYNDGAPCDYNICMIESACNYGDTASCSGAPCNFPGCTDPSACFFNPSAGCDDNSCTYPGCTNASACNYDSTAGCNDGSCQDPGCNNQLACNYNSNAGCDDGSCLLPGCEDSLACNYDEAAGCNDGSCQDPGCNNQLACNYNSNAGCDDGSCLFPGCTDSTACNFDPIAGCLNSSCYYHPNFLTCDGECINDVDGDNICDEYEVPGCSNVLACNYLPNAIDTFPGLCVYSGCTNPLACNYDSTAGCNDGTCVFSSPYLDCDGNCITDFDNDSVCDELELAGCADSNACNYISIATDTLPDICAYSGCTNFFACNYNEAALCNDGSCIFYGCSDTLACNYNPSAGCQDNSVCFVSGCNILAACNYNPEASCNDNSCVFPGCNDAIACNYDPQAGCGNSTLCNYPGCTQQDACNYNASALCDDNSCVFPGCTDAQACNYESLAGCDDGSCNYPGCNDPLACSYDAAAGCNDGSCSYPGCNDTLACNYDLTAGCDDGTCAFPPNCISGCTDSEAVNYLPLANFSTACFYSPEILIFHDVNENGIQDSSELGLPNRPLRIAIGSDEWLVYSNGSGHVEFNTSDSLTITTAITVSTAESDGSIWGQVFPFSDTIITPADLLLMPMKLNSLQSSYQVVAFDGISSHIDCAIGYHGGVIVTNTGADSLEVSLSLDITPLTNLGFVLVDSNYFETIASSGDSQLSWNVLIPPGQLEILTLSLAGPGTELDSSFVFHYEMTINGSPVSIMDHNLEIYCDDNLSDGGLIANPSGIYAPNYVLSGDEIIYIIQFNYDGNPERSDSCAAGATAYRVLTSDTVDSYSMELSSIQPIANSHESVCSVTVEEIDGNRAVIEFDFTGINLRADTIDGMSSSGYALFSAQLQQGLEPNWEIPNVEQTFFFDSVGCNCDAVMMDYFHTIFGCDFFVPESLELCEGPATSLNAADPFADYYAWSSAGVDVIDSVFSFAGALPGEYNLQLITGNALCSDTNQFSVSLNALPQIILVPEAISICAGDSVTLVVQSANASDLIEWDNGIVNGVAFYPEASATANFVVTDIINDSVSCSIGGSVSISVGEIPAGNISFDSTTNTYSAPDGFGWQWYVNNEAIVGANSQTYVADPLMQGEYSVMVTSAEGCEAFIIGIIENNVARNAQVFPNPMKEETTILLPVGVFDITLYDLWGRKIFTRKSCTQREVIYREGLSAGSYALHISNEGMSEVIRLVLE